VGAVAAFVVLRASNIYGDPRPWHPGDSLAVFLDATKYPPSLQFLCMTLGPGFLLLRWLDGRGEVGALSVYGRVPLFYYIAHFYLLHALAVAAGMFAGYSAAEMCVMFFRLPKEYGFSLPIVYAVWLAVVAILYLPCRWFASLKARRRDLRWLSYL
jgi:hypothetical protein